MDAESQTLLDPKADGDAPGAVPSWALALPSPTRPDCRLPQNIAHRGDRANRPENTMAAFRSAVAAGAHALETDLHLSKDGVVVLSHDATLKRCYGEEARIKDRDWEYLKGLRTLNEPREPLPRLADLLEYLAKPELESKWLLLDIKTDDDMELMIASIAKTIADAPEPRPWTERIVLGCWEKPYFAICARLLPGFPVAYIGWSVTYARRFLRHNHPPVSFNLLQKTLVGPLGGRLIRDAHRSHPRRAVYAWTVNEPEWMAWSVDSGLDGVITDDPALFRDVLARYEADEAKARMELWGSGVPLRRKLDMAVDVARINLFVSFGLVLLVTIGRSGILKMVGVLARTRKRLSLGGRTAQT